MSNHQYFAQINDNNVVTNVAVVHQDFLQENPDRYLGTWVETFFDIPNKTYAGMGFIYNPTTKDFTPPPPPYIPINETPTS
jgi:hypothetical protein